MRIGVDTLFLDGSRSSLANFVVAFAHAMVSHSKHHRLVFFASNATAKLFNGLPEGSIELVHCSVSNESPLARIIYQQTKLPLLASRNRIDVFCCLADVAPLGLTVPVVLKVNSLHHFTVPGSIGHLRALYRRIMIGQSARRARLVVANSTQTAADIRSQLKVPDRRIRLVYEAVADYFTPYTDQVRLAEILKKRHDLSAGYLLFVSALYRYKRLDSVMRAIAELVSSKRWDGTLVVVGSNPHGYRQELERLAVRLRVHERVRFLGPIQMEHLRELYCGASALIYPSASETFGKPIVEAMRCGTAIVATDRGSIPDIAAGAALLVDPDDVSSLAHAIDTLLRDEPLRSRLRQIGLKRGTDFSWPAVAAGFTRVLEEAGS